MIMQFNRNSREADADLRESYRQRLNEIFDAGRFDGGGSSAPLQPSAPPAPPVLDEDLEPVILVRTEEPAAPIPGAKPVRMQEPAVPPRPEESKAMADDVLEKAAERVTKSLIEFWSSAVGSFERRHQEANSRLEAATNDLGRLQGEVAELREFLGTERRSLETQVLAALTRIDQRLETLDNAVQSQAQAVAALGASNERLEQAQQASKQRLDTQADAVRELGNAVGVQQARWADYRAAVEKLREITDVQSQPVQLPENL